MAKCDSSTTIDNRRGIIVMINIILRCKIEADGDNSVYLWLQLNSDGKRLTDIDGRLVNANG